MRTDELKNLKIGDLVYYLSNTGSAGIFKYQYLGIFTPHTRNEKPQHLFISEYFLSTCCITVGKEDTSRNLKRIFLTEKEVLAYRKQLILDEQNEF